jgi:hypothetical protein
LWEYTTDAGLMLTCWAYLRSDGTGDLPAAVTRADWIE